MAQRAGQLHERVSLLRATRTRDAAGQPTMAWEAFATAWAAARPQGGSEAPGDAGAQRSEQAVEFTVRFREDLDTTCRILWRGRTFDLTSVAPAGRGLREFTVAIGTESR